LTALPPIPLYWGAKLSDILLINELLISLLTFFTEYFIFRKK
jgi:hypothetical protein